MGEIMRAIPFADLLDWTMNEYKKEASVFGISKDKFYRNESGTSIEMFGDSISSPIGPAAGPASQLAQNIVANYLAGARFVELKTIQTLDGEDLRKAVPRPCINAEDEGYNVEWSTELTVEEAYDEYVKGWMAIHVLMKEFKISEKRDFVFNISAGYDLEGVKSPKIDNFINGMLDASNTPIWKECVAAIEERLDSFTHFTKADLDKIDTAVSPSITISTLHGCPPEEIEGIAKHFMEVKGLHTYVKCNPTLLGYEYARKTLDSMGYSYISFDEHHFNNDLQFKDAVPMFERLIAIGKEKNLDFGVKITNTFPVKIEKNELPGEEMYMSGRSLYALSVSVARNLSQAFDGRLPISYSGGADFFNIKDLFAVGIQPITMATTLLKPGGYNRLQQMATVLEKELDGPFKGISVKAIEELTENAIANPRHQKEIRSKVPVKTNSSLPLWDCYKSPCSDGGCPINQQIPTYVNLVDREEYEKAFNVITIDNPLPSVTGALCDHNCQNKCVRNNYDTPVGIKVAKLKAANKAQNAFIENIVPAKIKTDKKAVVIGAGPAGIAVSTFLRRNGMEVTVREKQDNPFGVVRHVIPTFRIDKGLLNRDFEMAKKQGVNFEFGVEATYNVNALLKEFDFVVIATGAWKAGISPVSEGQENVIDALEFLSTSHDKDLALGKEVAVIGAGDVAMDCARRAKRTKGVEKTAIVYRRTREFMPAILDEIKMAEADGVEIFELLAPQSYDGKTLVCEVQALTEERDDSGRKLMKGTGEIKKMSFDTVIGAVGARVDNTPYKENNIPLNDKGMPIVSQTNETLISNVYMAGDGKAGASTIVRAIADAKAIATSILAKAGLAHDFTKVTLIQPEKELLAKKGVLMDEYDTEKCLSCDQLCRICVDVCPNRANVNIIIHAEGMSYANQILHIDGMCNECGNCGTFCPHAGNPYKDKFTLFWTKDDFEDSQNTGFLPLSQNTFMIRDELGVVLEYTLGDKGKLSFEMEKMIQVVIEDYPFFLVAVEV